MTYSFYLCYHLIMLHLSNFITLLSPFQDDVICGITTIAAVSFWAILGQVLEMAIWCS